MRTIVLLAAVVLLSASLASCHRIIHKVARTTSDLTMTYDHPERFVKGSYSSTDAVDEIEINWVGGTIEIGVSESDTLYAIETADGSLNDTTMMHWYKDYDGTLHLAFIKPTRSVSLRADSSLHKNLIVKVPYSMPLEDISVNGVDVTLNIKDVQCKELDVSGVSIHCGAIFDKAPEDVSVNGVNMQAFLTLPQGTSVSVETDGVGCTFDSEIPLCKEDQAACEVSADGVSCYIHVRQNKPAHK